MWYHPVKTKSMGAVEKGSYGRETDMNYLRNELTYLSENRINRYPDRRDRAVLHRGKCGEKVCRPDRFVPGRAPFHRGSVKGD